MEEMYVIKPLEEAKMTVFDSSIDLGTDIAEISIDMLQDDGIIKDFPILGSVYKIGKTGYSIGRLLFIKKTITFAQEIQRNDVDNSILQIHKEKFYTNPKKYYKELEIILEYLNRQVGCKKSIFNGRAYYIYLTGQIDYEDFNMLLEIIDQLYLSDLEYLKELYSNRTIPEKSNYNSISCKRLSNCGLIDFFNGMAVTSKECDTAILAQMTSIGDYFCKNILQI